MDALSDVLRLVGLTGGVFLDAEFTAPWSVCGKVSPEFCGVFMAPPERIVAFHYVLEGELMVVLDGASWRVRAGEVVMLPHNDLHVFASAADISPRSVAEIIHPSADVGVYRIAYRGGGARTRMICGLLGANAELHPLLASLPPIMTLDLTTLPSGDWMARTFDYATQTFMEGAAGAATVMAKVSELMFVEALRRYLAALAPNATGWLAGLRDPVVGRSLTLMHARLREDWTTEALAKEVHLSRSAFAERFSALVGMPPMRYLLGWRMQVAKQKLRETRLLVAQIAFEVGYESEAAFARAFRRETGLPPAAWRTEKVAG